MKRVFEITNKYIILATPLLLFSLFVMIFLITTHLSNVFFFILLAIMFVAFASGWFNMIKIAIDTKDFLNNPNALLKEFPQGVGEYFLSILGAGGVAVILGLVLFLVGYLIGDLTIGIANVPLNELRQALTKPETLEIFLKGLSSEQLTNLMIWYLWSLVVGFILDLALILYLPAIFYKTKNPFRAFIISIKNLFSKSFLKTLIFLLGLLALNTIISILVPLSSGNLFLNGIMILIKFYVITIIFVSIFYYYKKNFVE